MVGRAIVTATPSSPPLLQSPTVEDGLAVQIAHEQRMYDGCRSLARSLASGHQATNETLEAAKALLVSENRLARLKHKAVHNKTSTPDPYPCSPASLILSDLRLPLTWPTKRAESKHHLAVVCLLSSGTTLVDTHVVHPVDRASTDVTFCDHYSVPGLKPGFLVQLEVFAALIDADGEPRGRLKESGNRSASKRHGGALQRKLEHYQHGFERVATCSFRFDDVENGLKCYDLKLASESPVLPLEGHVCCKLRLLPESSRTALRQGWLMSGGPTSTRFERFWCSLQSAKLSCYLTEDAHAEEMPESTIDIDKGTRICLRSSDDHVTYVELCTDEGALHMITGESLEDTQAWCCAFAKQISDLEYWSEYALMSESPHRAYPLAIPPDFLQRFSTSRSYKQPRSLYEEIGTDCSDYHDILMLSPSHPRSRTTSLPRIDFTALSHFSPRSIKKASGRLSALFSMSNISSPASSRRASSKRSSASNHSSGSERF